ncbi:iron complex transport system permease protein [Barrientosiimonas humi]|uniref:Iron complex transport system permease protein n=1 Tax=Barrientosiimonas humi TaxID=999931 RepID=A0A542XFM8_9MICO|nr:iron chelate uptake ABC transporter family permease subunit [Barrientosiimonas humi]TQL34626.1 iron complex transport system permease protein [Barrientosiimonas humi]CAG7574616.1 Ferric enterobactin transport system permease protein FepG [Barrientosiimonas humi]
MAAVPATALEAPETEPARAREVVRDVRRRVRRRAAVAFVAVGLLWFVLFAARVLLGDYTVTAPDFVRIVLGEDIPVASFLVMESKLPRAVVGTLAGISFGVSGAVFQSMLRNPLASPDVIGVSMGASAAAVIGILWFGLEGGPVALLAIGGGLLVALAVTVLSGSRGTATMKLILIGIGLAAALQSLVQWVFITADVRQASDALVWLTGSLNMATWTEIGQVALAVLVLLPVVAVLVPRLRVLELGDDASQGLGVRAAPTRLALMCTVVLMMAITTSVVGPIAFVALLSGPIARRLNGGRTAIALAGVVGACIVVAADYVGAYGVGDDNLPVGVVTGIAGAPFLLWLLVRSRRVIKDG